MHYEVDGEIGRATINSGSSGVRRTVAKLLKEAGYSLQSNLNTVEGTTHPDRDAQFVYLNEQVTAFQGTDDPVISVDTKKKLRREVARCE